MSNRMRKMKGEGKEGNGAEENGLKVVIVNTKGLNFPSFWSI